MKKKNSHVNNKYDMKKPDVLDEVKDGGSGIQICKSSQMQHYSISLKENIINGSSDDTITLPLPPPTFQRKARIPKKTNIGSDNV